MPRQRCSGANTPKGGTVMELAEGVEAYARQEPQAADVLMAVISNIGHLYSSHIWKEDNMVFPMVDRLFSGRTLRALPSALNKQQWSWAEARNVRALCRRLRTNEPDSTWRVRYVEPPDAGRQSLAGRSEIGQSHAGLMCVNRPI